MERSRQYRLILSDREWEMLIHIADDEGAPASEILRALVQRRYEALSKPDAEDLRSVADALRMLSRRLGALADARDRAADTRDRAADTRDRRATSARAVKSASAKSECLR